MNPSYFFGYGSLVNTATHSYRDAHPARLMGWRRQWVQTDLRPLAFLSVAPSPQSQLDGLVAAVPENDWHALDQREFAYQRHRPEQGLEHPLPQATDVQIYAVSDRIQNQAQPRYPVFLSYLDVVVQGYLHVFGEDGVEAFFQTTDGWDRPFLNDRAAPRYPRHQVLTPDETAMVDAWAAKLQLNIEMIT